MTDYEFGQAVMAAAGVEPCIQFGCGRISEPDLVLVWDSHKPNMEAWAARWNERPGHPTVEVREIRHYPDPLTAAGFDALWDALEAKGWYVTIHPCWRGPMRANEEGDPIDQGDSQMVLFEGISIRKVFHESQWHFAIVDIIAALTGSDRPSKYWSDLKTKLVKDEGFTELSDKIGQLKMEASDGKFYLTDTVTVETALRVIQSIPSRKAEPFKRWLAKVGYERIQEIQDPEIAVKRAILMWQAQGRTSDWIEARLRCIVVRKELTDQWQKGGISGAEYGRLTNIVAKETFDLDTAQHKNLKGLKGKHKLRDHMTDLELVFTMLGEKSTTEIAKASDAVGFAENAIAAKSGGRVAGDARRDLERRLKRSVVSRANFLSDSRTKDPERLTQPSPPDSPKGK